MPSDAFDIKLRERHLLREWSTTVRVGSPKLLFAYKDVASFLNTLPVCKADVTKSHNLLALMHHDGELEITGIEGDTTTVTDVLVTVLADPHPEWCLMSWSDSGSILLSTRSSAIIDCFSTTGVYCYSIPLQPRSNKDFKVSTAISHIATKANTDGESKYHDTLYVLQYNGTFSCYQIGSLAGYFLVFKVDLGQRVATSFVLVPTVDILIVSSQYRVVADKDVPTCSSLGLNVYRICDDEPYVIDVRAVRNQVSFWDAVWSWLPFCSPQTAVMNCMAVNQSLTSLACISSTGDMYVMSLPALNLIVHASHRVKNIPHQVIWTTASKVALLTKEGLLFTGEVAEMKDKLESNETDECETFEPCTLLFSAHNDAVFALEAHRQPAESNRSLLSANNRALLAARLNLTNLYDYFKAYLDAAVGQPLEEVPPPSIYFRYSYKLHVIRTITVTQLYRKLLQEGAFEEALEAAKKYGTEDVDFIYKEKWRLTHAKDGLKAITGTLMKIKDKAWVTRECLECVVTDMCMVTELMKIAMKNVSGKFNEQHAVVLHYARILEIFESDRDICLYYTLRFRSLLDTAVNLARKCLFKFLTRLIAQNYGILYNYLFVILTNIPECADVRSYSHLMPCNKDGWFHIENAVTADRFHGFNDKAVLKTIEAMNDDTDVLEKFDFPAQYTNVERLTLNDVVAFLKSRSFVIESCSLVKYSIAFLKVAIDRGFENLNTVLTEMKFFEEYIMFSCNVRMSFLQFQSLPANGLFRTLEKCMTETTASKYMSRILSLLEHLCETRTPMPNVEEIMCHFVCSFSACSLQILYELKKEKPSLITPELVISCLMVYRGVGEALIFAARDFNVSPNLIKALEIFNSHKVDLSFEMLQQSIKSVSLARNLLQQLVKSAKFSLVSECKSVKNDLLKLRDILYSEVLSVEDILQCLALEILMRTSSTDTRRQCLDLILSFGDPKSAYVSANESRLSLDQSVNFLIDTSYSYWYASSQSHGDKNKEIARRVLGIASEQGNVSKHLKIMDAYDLAVDLGCTLTPIQFRYANSETILSDTIHINGNYKKAKKCALLAQLLRIRTPVAKAMVMCAIAALEAGDEVLLRNYCSHVIGTTRNIEPVHKLCVSVLKSPYLLDMHDSLACCALLNCPQYKLMETLILIGDRVRRNLPTFNDRPIVSACHNIVPDPNYTTVREYICNTCNSDEELEMLHLNYHPAMTTEQKDSIIANVARKYSQISSTAALYISLELPEDTHWTNNIFLENYAQAIRALRRNFPLSLIQNLPPELLMRTAIPADYKSGSALSRIMASGCDPDRFLMEREYQMDTLVGLAMTKNRETIVDCIEIAEKYKQDAASIFMSSLEFIITDPESTPVDLRELVSDIRLKKKVEANKPQLLDFLRGTVLKRLLEYQGPCLSRAEVYLSFFDDDQPEAHVFSTLLRLEKLLPEVNVLFFVSPSVETCVEKLFSLLPRCSEEVGNILLNLPKGRMVCHELLRRILSTAWNFDVLECCENLVAGHHQMFVEALSVIPARDELEILEKFINTWEFKKGRMEHMKLRQLIQKRWSEISRMCSSSFHQNEGTSLRRRKEQ